MCRISSTGNRQQINCMWQQSSHFCDLDIFPYNYGVTTCSHTMLFLQWKHSHKNHHFQLLPLEQISSFPVILPWPCGDWSYGYKWVPNEYILSLPLISNKHPSLYRLWTDWHRSIALPSYLSPGSRVHNWTKNT